MIVFWKTIRNESSRKGRLRETLKTHFPKERAFYKPHIIKIALTLAFYGVTPLGASRHQTDTEASPLTTSPLQQEEKNVSQIIDPEPMKDSDAGGSDSEEYRQEYEAISKLRGSLRVGALPGGNFVITWKERASPNDPWHIYARLYNVSKIPLTEVFQVDSVEKIRNAPEPFFPEELRILGEVVPSFVPRGPTARIQVDGALHQEADIYHRYSMLDSLKILKRGEASYFDPRRGSWTSFEGGASLPECLFQKKFQKITAPLFQNDDYSEQGQRCSGNHLTGAVTNLIPLYPLGGHYQRGLPFEGVAQAYFYLCEKERKTWINPLSQKECISKGFVPEEHLQIGHTTYFFPLKSEEPQTSLAEDLMSGECVLTFQKKDEQITYCSTHYERLSPLSSHLFLYFKKKSEGQEAMPKNLSLRVGEPLDKKDEVVFSIRPVVRRDSNETVTASTQDSDSPREVLEKSEEGTHS